MPWKGLKLMMRKLLSASGAVAAALVAAGSSAGAAEGAAPTAGRPNIVFILADDAGVRDFGAFGQDKIKTPNIDRLASEGMKLTTHYSGNAVCAPSRCVLLSGLHPGHAHVRDNRHADGYAPGDHEGQVPVPADYLKLPLTLKQLGYTNGAFGKWGLGPVASTGNPLKQGIDRFSGYICQSVAHNYYPSYIWDNDRRVSLDNPPPAKRPVLVDGADPADPASYRSFDGKQYAPDLYGQAALQFVRDNKDKPFFLYYPTIVPHLAYQVPADSLKEYEGKFPEEPYLGQSDYVPQRTPRAAYAAEITRLDREVGKLVALVHDLGLDEKTIFVFTSDNGAPPGIPTSYFNSGGIFRGSKGTIYEGGLREPLIVRWKGKIAPGSQSDRVTGFEDWLPTLLELAGASGATPAGIDGISFAPTLLGKAQEARPFLYREFPNRGQFVRVGKWKAIRQGPERGSATQPGSTQQAARAAERLHRFPGAPEPRVGQPREPGAIELYDLETDPSEQHDVVAEHPDVVARLSEVLKSQHVPSDLFPLAVLNEKGGGTGDGSPAAKSRD
jgi:arylsulfatase A-like enzyme